MPGRMLYLYALSPIHSGTGQAVEAIDQPIARETVTGWPFLPGSSVKGVLRDACRPADGADTTIRDAWVETFGPETTNADERAGGLWFADARLLCFPVRSLVGSFAWVTCPLALRRWARDHATADRGAFTLKIPDVPQTADPATPPPILLESLPEGERHTLARGQVVLLEDLDLEANFCESAKVGAIAAEIAGACFPTESDQPTDPNRGWQQTFRRRFGIVSDDLFGFLAETATEVIARVKLEDQRKTVEQGKLWYEEAVPAEAIFAAPLVPAPRQNPATLFGVVEPKLERPLQIGGKASVGRGLVWARLTPVAGRAAASGAKA